MAATIIPVIQDIQPQPTSGRHSGTHLPAWIFLQWGFWEIRRDCATTQGKATAGVTDRVTPLSVVSDRFNP